MAKGAPLPRPGCDRGIRRRRRDACADREARMPWPRCLPDHAP